MIKIIRSEDRYHADHGWLETRWHFSFGDYYDPANMNWGKLRVFNDDVVKGGGGFGMHPHRDMEIITYMINGTLRHRDSLGNTDTLKSGEVQVMSAGKGITHAEFNESDTEPLRLVQIWIEPRTLSNPPRWEQKAFTKADRENKLLPVVSSGNISGSLAIDQDAAIYVSSLAAGKSVAHTSAPKRNGYLFVIDGEVELNGQPLHRGDQARIRDETDLKIQASKDSELILLDIP